MKLYCYNEVGTVKRIDRIPFLKDKLPTDTDIIRRTMLHQQSGTAFEPFALVLDKETFRKFRQEIKDKREHRNHYNVVASNHNLGTASNSDSYTYSERMQRLNPIVLKILCEM